VLTVCLAGFLPDAGFIEAHQLQTALYVQLSVSDTGAGMTPEIQKRIFDPFFTTKDKGKGTGIGLSLTHDIIKGYGGAITVSSAPGEGTTFNVFLPAMDGQQFIEGESESVMPTGNERILFVDDEDALADLGKQMIEALGYQVTSRVDGLEAWNLFRTHPERFDLVITDLVMPDFSGEDLIREIRNIRPDIPVILVTGFTEQMPKEKAASLGIDRLMNKPVVMKDMARFIRDVLARRRKVT
jgi:CheY-like chemotaxis protein